MVKKPKAVSLAFKQEALNDEPMEKTITRPLPLFEREEHFMGLVCTGALSSKHSFRLVNINLLEQQPAFFLYVKCQERIKCNFTYFKSLGTCWFLKHQFFIKSAWTHSGEEINSGPFFK